MSDFSGSRLSEARFAAIIDEQVSEPVRRARKLAENHAALLELEDALAGYVPSEGHEAGDIREATPLTCPLPPQAGGEGL